MFHVKRPRNPGLAPARFLSAQEVFHVKRPTDRQKDVPRETDP